MPRHNRPVRLSIALHFLAKADNSPKIFWGLPTFSHIFHHRLKSSPKQPNGPGGDESAGINKASKDYRFQPEPPSIPRDIFPRTEPAGARLALWTVQLSDKVRHE